METKATSEVCKSNHMHHPAGSFVLWKQTMQSTKSIKIPCTEHPTRQRFTRCNPETVLQKIQRGDLRRIAKCSCAKLQRCICKASWARKNLTLYLFRWMAQRNQRNMNMFSRFLSLSCVHIDLVLQIPSSFQTDKNCILCCHAETSQKI